MKRTCITLLIGTIVAMTIIPLHAGVLRKGFNSAFSGAALGSLLDGQKGARKGAAIGGAVGVLGGVADASKKQAAEDARKRQEAERQRAIQEQQQREAEQLKAQQDAKATETKSEESTTQVLEIQKSLVRMGYDPGDVDGKLSPATENAIRLYETKYGLLVTGRPSSELLKHMLRNGG